MAKTGKPRLARTGKVWYNIRVMDALLTFLEGVISFISPCMLPLLPVYVAYFAIENSGLRRTFLRAVAFVVGFSAVFVTLGVFAGSLGARLAAHRTAVNVACGIAVVVFGLGYLGFFRLPLTGDGVNGRPRRGLLGAFTFGLVYSVSLTPCVGAFLGAALMQAASSGAGAAKGAALLAAYCCGLGIPFIASALVSGPLMALFGAVKRHYGVITPVSGLFLIAYGGWMVYAALRPVPAVPDADAPTPPSAETAPAQTNATASPTQPKKEVKMEIQLTAANFEAEVLKSQIPVLVDFWAPWCGPCRMLAPLVEELAREKAGIVKVGKVNVDEAPDLAAKFGIMSIPTLILFKNGQQAAQSVGLVSKDDLARFVAQ